MFARARQEVFVPLCREFATHKLSLDALDGSGRVKSIMVDVGKNGECGELALREREGVGPLISLHVRIQPGNSLPLRLNLWEIVFSQPPRFSLFAPPQNVKSELHWVTSRAVLCHRILGRALELVAGAEVALARAEEEKETEIDDGVPGKGFLGPNGHTIAFVM